MAYKAIYTCYASLGIVLFLLASPDSRAQEKVSSNEYAVYGVVLSELYRENLGADSGKPVLVIQMETHASVASGSPYQNLERDFYRMNWIRANIEKQLPPADYAATYYLILKAEIDELLERGTAEWKKQYDRQNEYAKLNNLPLTPATNGPAWKLFYEKFPGAGAYYTFSRVGFSGRFAMVNVSWRSEDCELSSTYILRKVRRVWKVYSAAGGGGCA